MINTIVSQKSDILYDSDSIHSACEQYLHTGQIMMINYMYIDQMVTLTLLHNTTLLYYNGILPSIDSQILLHKHVLQASRKHTHKHK